MTKAGGSINIFSESTHIEALIKACKMMKIKKKSYLYNSTVHGCFKGSYEYDNNIAAHRLARLKILLCWKPVLFQSGTMAV